MEKSQRFSFVGEGGGEVPRTIRSHSNKTSKTQGTRKGA